jgi:hypothetical protein
LPLFHGSRKAVCLLSMGVIVCFHLTQVSPPRRPLPARIGWLSDLGPLSLDEQSVHVWHIAASAHLARVPSLHGLLVSEQRARAARFHRKEACLKACGDGLAKGTDHFEVSVDPRAPASLLVQEGALRSLLLWGRVRRSVVQVCQWPESSEPRNGYSCTDSPRPLFLRVARASSPLRKGLIPGRGLPGRLHFPEPVLGFSSESARRGQWSGHWPQDSGDVDSSRGDAQWLPT